MLGGPALAEHLFRTRVPRALFQLFRSGGINLLEAPKGQEMLSAGHRFVVDYHYASYR